MAQAARLNLRMQKELKLLLTDPPPGASFPHSDLSSFSLSTIHAEIEGPEGTVYEKGRFKIKIQIPERYPFQPPIVTFSTPIYHPNIDTGGRICLDILNLPPKGAWQPSLNISTVLTSIGLLLCEPNPDDGLMCEASREYKYDRQTFDHKARSMTEKYGKSGAIEEESDLQSHSNSPMMESKSSELEKNDINETSVRFNTLSGIRRKLSLETSGSSLRDANKGVDEVSSDRIGNQLQVLEAKQESEDVSRKYSQNHEKLHRKRQNLSMGLLGPNHARGGDEKENVNPHQGTTTTVLTPQSISLESLESLPVLQPKNQHQNQPHQLLHHHKDLKSRLNSSAKLSHFGQKRSHENIRSDERTDDCENNKIPKESTDEPDLNVLKRNLLVPSGIMNNECAIEAPKGSAHDKSCFTIPKRKKLGLAGKKPSVGVCALAESSENCNKGNIASNSIGVLPKMSSIAKSTGTSHGHVTTKKMLQQKPLDQLEGTNGCDIIPSEPTGDAQKQERDNHEVFCGDIKQYGEELCVSEEVIVLDSEDSEEEKEKASKLSIARRRALGKWRAKS